MSAEQAFIERLRGIATGQAARGLLDDAALLTPPPGRDLVLTHDMLVEGVHFLAEDLPGDIAWKLVAVNLSDLAAKGAEPVGVLLGYMLGPDPGWDAAFADGLAEVTAAFDAPLLGGDTVAGPLGSRSFGLTAIGAVATGRAPSRAGARPGDGLWVTGTIGDAGLGLRLAMEGAAEPASLLTAYRRPLPRIGWGQALAALASAAADVSDGLLIDAGRIASASGCGVAIDLRAAPLSPAARALAGDDLSARLAAATAGDDYELLLAIASEAEPHASAIAAETSIPFTRVGRFVEAPGLHLSDGDAPVPVPARLGFEHGRAAD